MALSGIFVVQAPGVGPMPEPRFRSSVRHDPTTPEWRHPLSPPEAKAPESEPGPVRLSGWGRPGPVTSLIAGTGALLGGTAALLATEASLRWSWPIGAGAFCAAALFFYGALTRPAERVDPRSQARRERIVARPAARPTPPAPRPTSRLPAPVPLAAPPILRLPALVASPSPLPRAGAMANPALRTLPPRPRTPSAWEDDLRSPTPAAPFVVASGEQGWHRALPDEAFWGAGRAPPPAPVAAPTLPGAPSSASARAAPAYPGTAPVMSPARSGPLPEVSLELSPALAGGHIRRVGAATPPLTEAPCAECGRIAGGALTAARCPRCARPLCAGCSARFERTPAEVPCYHQLGSLS